MAIPNVIQTNHHVGTTVEDITTSIDVEDFPFLADMMNGLYSDPIAAVLREYPTNAWDSHVEAGVTRPIEVTLPTPFNPQLVVRDFGLGLSVNDLRDVYSKYGRSLKRESNNVAGQLGMGCKSALSYAPSFTINAVKGGVRVVAIFTKNERGLGVIKVLDTVATDDPNGVTITVPVETNDIHAFASKADEIFRFWEPGTVLVNGKPPKAPEYLDAALWLDTERQTCLVRDDSLYTSYVVMGNVAYPVPDAYRSDGNTITVRRFVANLNIGDVDFVPSREDVKYTARTKATLAELTDYIFSSFGQAFAKSLKTVSTPWEETKLKLSWSANTHKAQKALSLRGSTDSPIWEYNPGHRYGRRQAQASHQASLSPLIRDEKTVVITGLSAKTLSPVARERIRTYAPADFYLVLTTGVTGVGLLEGRPNVHRYADVLAATTPERRERNADGTRAPKIETRYTVRHGAGLATESPLTVKELAKLAEDPANTLLYLESKSKLHYTDAITDDNVYVVKLYSSLQLPRIQRSVPAIRRYHEQVRDWQNDATRALTEADKLMHHVQKVMPRVFYSLPADKVDDPTLAKFIRLHKSQATPTMVKAMCLGMTIPEPSTNNRLPNFNERYPLLSNMYRLEGHMLAEAVLYVNAKYEATVLANATVKASA